MPSPQFIHLRLHSEYSISDGTVRLDDALARAAADGMPALALTDLANLFGVVKFYRGARETGVGTATGTTLNVPLPPGSGDEDYLQAFDRIIEPMCRRFEPEFVLVSAGFDPHTRDPLASMEMTRDGFATLARRVQALADEHCDGRWAAVLEGGYDLLALRDSVIAVFRVMCGLAEEVGA